MIDLPAENVRWGLSKAKRVTSTWSSIASWWTEHGVKVKLGAPANKPALSAFEKLAKVRVPEDVRLSLAVHDGVRTFDGPAYTFSERFYAKGFVLFSVAEMTAAWKQWARQLDTGTFATKKPKDTVFPVWWSKGWIPIASDADGQTYFVDGNPDGHAESFAQGGVLMHGKAKKFGPTSVSTSFEEWLYDYAKDLFGGRFKVTAGRITVDKAFDKQQAKQAQVIDDARQRVRNHMTAKAGAKRTPEVSIADAWGEIRAWWKANGVADTLRSGARETAVAAFEQELGATLPEDYRASLLLHDGEYASVYGYDYLSIKSARDSWRSMNRLLAKGTFKNRNASDRKTFPQWWSDRWVPFAMDSGGNYHCLDLSNKVHTVIAMENQDGQGPYKTDHASFLGWLQRYARGLQQGLYVVKYGSVMER